MDEENISRELMKEICNIKFDLEHSREKEIHNEKSAPFNENGNVPAYDPDCFYNNGKPVFFHSGEMHYYRVPRKDWERRIIQMKNGGINCISSYVFWGIHEPCENRWNFEGRYDIRHFAALCKKHKMFLHMRIGPLINSETTHGGMPNWVYEKLEDGQLFPTREWYLDAAGRLYSKLAEQLRDFFPSKGGNIIFIQLDNETNCEWFYGKAMHKKSAQYMIDRLLTLAIEAGFEGPFGCTYWTSVCARGALPLMGGYPAGIWEMQKIDCFKIRESREQFETDGLEGMAQRKEDGLINRDQVYIPDHSLYPVFGVENQSGRAYYGDMPPTFAAAYCLYKISCGESASNYYVYSGGTNPQRYPGKWFDVPFGVSVCREVNVMSYDMNAPIGEFGQIRQSYHYIRRLGLMLRDFGANIARGRISQPTRDDLLLGNKQQVSFRGENASGYIFANAYKYPGDDKRQRVIFEINRGDEKFSFPKHTDLIIKRGIPAVLPLGIVIGGLDFKYASATPLCRLDCDGDMHLVFWSSGKAEYSIKNIEMKNVVFTNDVMLKKDEDSVCLISESSNTENLAVIQIGERKVFIKTLSEEDSLKAYNLEGMDDRLVFTDLIPERMDIVDGDKVLHFTHNNSAVSEEIRIYPGYGFSGPDYRNTWTKIQLKFKRSKDCGLKYERLRDGSYKCILDKKEILENVSEFFLTTTPIEKGYGVEVDVDGMPATDQWYREDEKGNSIPWSFGIKRFLVRNSRCWVLEKQPDGYYKILNKYTGLSLKVVVGKENRIVFDHDSDDDYVLWNFVRENQEDYRIESVATKEFITFCGEDDFNVCLSGKDNKEKQIFNFEYESELYYKIRHKTKDMYLDGLKENYLSNEEGDDLFEVKLRSYKQNLKVENHQYSTNYSYGDYVGFADPYTEKKGKVVLHSPGGQKK